MDRLLFHYLIIKSLAYFEHSEILNIVVDFENIQKYLENISQFVAFRLLLEIVSNSYYIKYILYNLRVHTLPSMLIYTQRHSYI